MTAETLESAVSCAGTAAQAGKLSGSRGRVVFGRMLTLLQTGSEAAR